MCGLIFHYHGAVQATVSVKKRMAGALQALAHRGPDEQQMLAVGPAILGHVRLSIIDLAASHQPMTAADGRYSLVFNGEIYNYRELRQALAGRWQFRTEGDTETLLAGLVLEGEAFLPRLEGMWAFAFWDNETRTLLLSRDRMGKKPLYYTMSGSGLACASELPALRKLSGAAWAEDPDSIADYFRYGYCLPGYTAWQGVFEVHPGHWLRWSPGRDVEQHSFWSIPLPGERPSASDEELVETLRQAVHKRLIADVEVGAFLSGGIDSSLVCALAQSELAQPIRTYTIGFAEEAYDERPYAELAARHIGTQHHAEVLAEWDEGRLETLLRQHVGQPFADSSMLPTALVSQAAARDVKVALSGDGADELFGGYQRYQARMILRWYMRLPKPLRRLAEAAVRTLPEPLAHHSRSVLKKAHLFVDVAQRQQDETPYVAPVMFRSAQFVALFPDLAGRGHTPPGLLEETHLGDLQRMLYADALVYLSEDILLKVDRASMAYGLETRAPFLDHRVVELAFSRSARQHMALGGGKRWLKSAFRDLLPAGIWQRRKQGFAVPVNAWFRGPLGENLLDRLQMQTGPVDRFEALRYLDEHRRGRDHGYRLWLMHAYLAFQGE
jgi:asparagine synthase (glutamine-hydrolysing)